MWYVLQTMTGREEELVHYIEEIVPKELYTDCFVAYYERVWRKQQESVVHVERLFPGYVFIVSDTPKELYLCLKKVPAMSKMIADGNFDFLSIEEEEEAFFREYAEKPAYCPAFLRGAGWKRADPPRMRTFERICRFHRKGPV